MIFFLCVILPLSANAGRHTARITELSAQMDSSSDPVSGTTLEEIAKVTYQAVADVPTEGLNSMQADLERIIALRKKLEVRPGISERLLSLTMQEGIDRSLLYEIYRKALYLQGIAFGFAFKPGSLNDTVFASLTEKNEVPETESIQYILGLNGSFAIFCRDRNIRPDELSEGKGIQKFSSDMQESLEKIVSDFFPKKMSRETMQNFLFGKTLGIIDKARDIRILSHIYMQDRGLPVTNKILSDKIDMLLVLKPDSRVSSREKNRNSFVCSTLSQYIGKSPDGYMRTLTSLFIPYFRNTDAVPAEVADEIPKNFIDGTKGVWLELEE